MTMLSFVIHRRQPELVGPATTMPRENVTGRAGKNVIVSTCISSFRAPPPPALQLSLTVAGVHLRPRRPHRCDRTDLTSLGNHSIVDEPRRIAVTAKDPNAFTASARRRPRSIDLSSPQGPSPSTPASPALATATVETDVDRPSPATTLLALEPAGSPSPSSSRTPFAVYPRRQSPFFAAVATREDYEFIEEQEFYPEVPPSPFADQGKSSTTPVETVDHI
ncbi:hypothetical protein GUJ93_ZPchr0009g1088 [Zizania palustris]|uniref:Uncharacterized protein n=1 Tax=Zizania palustris TaxID=103762 RepID=A0A8J5UXJ0_ZIZPA|nr:hypothetical protein GUJ93_ZPchr0009g1088 [Zizania palustris]